MLDGLAKDKLRADWAAWLSENHVDLLTEHPRHAAFNPSILRNGLDPVKTRVTAYVKDGVGYKLLRPRAVGIRAHPNAWKFGVYKSTMERDKFQRVLQIVESDRIGLASLFRGSEPMIGSDKRAFGAPSEPCEEHIGPPPDGCDYIEIDWALRRSSVEWCRAQHEAIVFGPQRMIRCLEGAMKSHEDLYTLADAIRLDDPRDILGWMIAGPPFIEDRYAAMKPEAWDTRYASRAAREARAILELSLFEAHWVPYTYWKPGEASAYIKSVKSG